MDALDQPIDATPPVAQGTDASAPLVDAISTVSTVSTVSATPRLHGGRRPTPDPFPRLTDWSLAVELASVTGLVTLVSGQAGDWLIFALHGALGLWILLLWGKLRRPLPRLWRSVALSRRAGEGQANGEAVSQGGGRA